MCADSRICTREGHLLRIVCHTDPVGGESYEFLTHVMDLPAGVVAELYRRRWEAEKVFDEIKNRLAEKKAWASSVLPLLPPHMPCGPIRKTFRPRSRASGRN